MRDARRNRIKDRACYRNISNAEGSMGLGDGDGGMGCRQVQWQAGQGDRERRGGEEGPGLGQRDPEGETRGRGDKERGETGREEAEASWLIEGEALSEGEEGMGGTGMAMGSDRLKEGTKVWSEGVVAVSEGAAVSQERSEVDLSEEVFVSARGVGEGSDGSEKGKGDGGLAAGEGGKGEVMRRIGEDGWGEKGKAGD